MSTLPVSNFCVSFFLCSFQERRQQHWWGRLKLSWILWAYDFTGPVSGLGCTFLVIQMMSGKTALQVFFLVDGVVSWCIWCVIYSCVELLSLEVSHHHRTPLASQSRNQEQIFSVRKLRDLIFVSVYVINSVKWVWITFLKLFIFELILHLLLDRPF